MTWLRLINYTYFYVPHVHYEKADDIVFVGAVVVVVVGYLSQLPETDDDAPNHHYPHRLYHGKNTDDAAADVDDVVAAVVIHVVAAVVVVYDYSLLRVMEVYLALFVDLTVILCPLWLGGNCSVHLVLCHPANHCYKLNTYGKPMSVS